MKFKIGDEVMFEGCTPGNECDSCVHKCSLLSGLKTGFGYFIGKINSIYMEEDHYHLVINGIIVDECMAISFSNEKSKRVKRMVSV